MPRVVGSPNPVGTASASGRSIRVALAVSNGAVSATSDFTWLSADGARVLGRGSRGESWFIQADSAGARVRAVSPAGVPLAWQSGLLARATDESFLTYAGKRYRGELVFVAQDTGFLVVNRLGIEDYLRGVVPLEMGSRPRSDTAALQAQAVASRSYAFVRGMDGGGYYDVRASTSDQVYGGVDAENALANAAVDATRGLVLRYQGRVVDAPFHSTCGGTTAAPSEIWRGPNGGAYLQSVSDRIPGSDRSYCDIAPRYRWTRALSATQLNAALEQYLKAYASVPADGPGTARAMGVSSRTASGRVGVLDVETDKGIFTLRGNDIRYVMRVPGGEMLPSTYFSVEPEVRDGALARVTFRGQGYGHGVGMCQWGAIGRARAGQSFRAILGTYYPGTSVGSVPSP
jgi:stage II sporulation protein D